MTCVQKNFSRSYDPQLLSGGLSANGLYGTSHQELIRGLIERGIGKLLSPIVPTAFSKDRLTLISRHEFHQPIGFQASSVLMEYIRFNPTAIMACMIRSLAMAVVSTVTTLRFLLDCEKHRLDCLVVMG